MTTDNGEAASSPSVFFQKLFVKRRAPKFEDMSAMIAIAIIHEGNLANPGKPWQTLANLRRSWLRPWQTWLRPGRSWQILAAPGGGSGDPGGGPWDPGGGTRDPGGGTRDPGGGAGDPGGDPGDPGNPGSRQPKSAQKVPQNEPQKVPKKCPRMTPGFRGPPNL